MYVHKAYLLYKKMMIVLLICFYKGGIVMKQVNTRELPKYTQYELSNLVNEQVKNSGKSITDLSSSLELSNTILNEVIEGEVIFKMPHYNAVSVILDESVEELLSKLEYEQTCYFRANENNSEIEEFVSKMDYLFTEWVYQSKLSGEIN